MRCALNSTNVELVLLLSLRESQAWEPPEFKEKCSRGEFQGILGAALGVRKTISRNEPSILGMASHDLSNAKTTILRATLGAVPGNGANPIERFSCFFKNWGGPRAPERRALHVQILETRYENIFAYLTKVLTQMYHSAVLIFKHPTENNQPSNLYENHMLSLRAYI